MGYRTYENLFGFISLSWKISLECERVCVCVAAIVAARVAVAATTAPCLSDWLYMRVLRLLFQFIYFVFIISLSLFLSVFWTIRFVSSFVFFQMGISLGVDKRLAINQIIFTEIVTINEQNIEMESKDLRTIKSMFCLNLWKN